VPGQAGKKGEERLKREKILEGRCFRKSLPNRGAAGENHVGRVAEIPGGTPEGVQKPDDRK